MSNDEAFLLVDDSSPAIVYHGDWQVLDLPDNLVQSFETYGSTVTYSGTNGSYATFNFTGTQVAVQCLTLYQDKPPEALFILDDSSPSSYTPPASTNGSAVVFYKSAVLSSDQHSLQIFVGGDTGAPVYLDVIAVDGASQGSSWATSAGGQVVQTAYANPLQSGASSGASSKSSVPVGAIVGGVVGGVAVIVIAALAILWMCWKRHRKQGPYFYGPSATAGELLSGEAKEISPFPTPDPQQPLPVTLHAPSAYSGSTLTAPSAPPSAYGGQYASYPPSSVDGSEQSSAWSGGTRSTTTLLTVTNAAPNAAGLTPGQRKALEAGLRTVPEAGGVQHADSGVRFDEHGQPSGSESSSVPADAPPVYSAD
ncbi:hypothetical protein PsYK624_019580 [Phanerochaete sordida]|uniref:Transmembrane protein n=1 Tax=Phanerochaete sordida TaxID=48140 RepID=A0A9P3G1B0_9APHY|nr:hypothetical protein PsYK624_019580 [Phanerochaete sordida]